MISLAVAILSLQQVPITPTERDRDVISAYLFSAGKEGDKQPPFYVVVPFSSGGLSKPCMEALAKSPEGTPQLLEQWTHSLQERNTERTRIDGLKWDRKIVFCDPFDNLDRALFRDREFYKLFQRDVRIFGPTLPGYSRDGKSAVVISWLGPNHIHSVHEVAILKLMEGKWKVAWRQLGYYL